MYNINKHEQCPYCGNKVPREHLNENNWVCNCNICGNVWGEYIGTGEDNQHVMMGADVLSKGNTVVIEKK